MTKLNCNVCYGISSKADDKHGHVIFWDYDDNDFLIFLKYLERMQKMYNLSDIYIIKSTNGYNALCLDIVNAGVIFDMGTNVFSPCDRDFYKYGYQRGYYTLRFDRDKILENVLISHNTPTYKKSFAHKVFLEWFFASDNLKIDYDNFFNDYTKLKIIQYPSKKNGFHTVDKDLPNYFDVLKTYGVKK